MNEYMMACGRCGTMIEWPKACPKCAALKPSHNHSQFANSEWNTGQAIDQAIADMINAFMAWPLPESVCADPCATRPGKGRVGTSLLTVSEAMALMQEVVRPRMEKLLREQALDQLTAETERLGLYDTKPKQIATTGGLVTKCYHLSPNEAS